ncbi:uncharacterized protein EI90DRAFT_3052962 [Cantharellus anzutake]|uniref:uncharacterized protein n=1 Tax=Cantharellus anzutake TaxID=1750568 RepID=UPI001907081E|nr:uncharacterized protein EI90DRAFT_3052962 [Cantharellus anzutake]KAF8333094.1 hypothetical protein EI90DRAFT_3052962 [Cantharellus anzutake]
MEVALADIARARARTASAVGGNDQVPSGGVAGDTADELASGQSGVGGSGAMIADVLTAGSRKPRDPLEPVLENLIGNSSDYSDNILDGVLQADGGGGTGGGTINYRTLIATTTAAANTLMAHGDPDSDMEMEDGDVDEDNASSSSSLDGREGIDGQEEHGLDPLYFFNSPLSNRSRNRGRGQVQGNRVRRATITGGDSDVSTDELNF